MVPQPEDSYLYRRDDAVFVTVGSRSSKYTFNGTVKDRMWHDKRGRLYLVFSPFADPDWYPEIQVKLDLVSTDFGPQGRENGRHNQVVLAAVMFWAMMFWMAVAWAIWKVFFKA